MEKTSRHDNFYDRSIIDNSFNLAVRGCGIFTLVPPDREAARSVDFGEIFWPISGSCLFISKDQEKIVRPGILWYYPPGSFHNYFPRESFHYCWLAISGRYCKAFFEMLGILPGANPTGLCPEKLFYTLGNKIDFYLRKEQKLLALNIAFRLLTQSLIVHPSSPCNGEILHDIKKRIDLEFVDPQLNVNSLAQDSGIHRGSLSRAFHRVYGVRISDYIASQRFEQAARLLRQGNASVQEIAKASGFSSASYFSRIFIKCYGVTPSAFRKKYNASSPDGKKEKSSL